MCPPPDVLAPTLLSPRLLNDTEIAKAKRDFELKKAAYDVEVQTKVEFTTYFYVLACRPAPRRPFGPSLRICDGQTDTPSIIYRSRSDSLTYTDLLLVAINIKNSLQHYLSIIENIIRAVPHSCLVSVSDSSVKQMFELVTDDFNIEKQMSELVTDDTNIKGQAGNSCVSNTD